MMTFWHRRVPLGELIVDTDPDIAYANQELNVAWSVLFDTMRFQGFATPVKKLNNPESPKARQRHGARFPVVIDINESFEYAVASVSYTEQVELLKTFSKTLAISKRMSPSDFSLDQQSAVSGFSKIVDSLPKLEARAERIRRLKYMEEQEAWPRNRAIMIRLGILDKASEQLSLRVKFADVDFPMSADEDIKRLDSDLKNNLTTRAKVLAERMGIGTEEAKKAVEENIEENKKDQPEIAPQPEQPSGGFLGGSIGKRKREKPI